MNHPLNLVLHEVGEPQQLLAVFDAPKHLLIFLEHRYNFIQLGMLTDKLLIRLAIVDDFRVAQILFDL